MRRSPGELGHVAGVGLGVAVAHEPQVAAEHPSAPTGSVANTRVGIIASGPQALQQRHRQQQLLVGRRGPRDPVLVRVQSRRRRPRSRPTSGGRRRARRSGVPTRARGPTRGAWASTMTARLTAGDGVMIVGHASTGSGYGVGARRRHAACRRQACRPRASASASPCIAARSSSRAASVVARERLREEEALAHVAVQLEQALQLVGPLDALGDGLAGSGCRRAR